MEKDKSFKGKAKRFWDKHRDVILIGGIGTALLVCVSYLNSSSSKRMDLKMDKLTKPEVPEIKYLGRNGLVITSYDSNVSGGEFITNGSKLENMGEFGEDISDLLGLSKKTEISSISFFEENEN